MTEITDVGALVSEAAQQLASVLWPLHESALDRAQWAAVRIPKRLLTMRVGLGHP